MLSPAQRAVAIEIVTYLILAYLLVILLFCLARLARRLVASGECAPSPGAWLRAARRLRASRRGSGNDKHRERVAREVAEMCSKLTASTAQLTMVMCIVTLLAMVRRTRSGETRVSTSLQDLAIVLYTLTATLMGTAPRVVRPSLLALWHVLLMAFHSLAVVGASSWEDVVYVGSFMVFPRVAFSFFSGHVCLAAFMNLVVLACAVYVYLTGSLEAGCDVEEAAGRRRPITMEIVYFFVTVLGTAVSRQAMWAYVGSKVQTSTLIGESSAMRRLLHLVCDVAIELDSDLAFVDNDPKFLAFLTLAPSREIERQPFKQFVPGPAEEGESFEERMRGDAGSSSQPGALHTSLRDSWGNHINVEVFFVPFERGDMTKHYFVGFKEYDEQPVAELRRFEPHDGHRRHRLRRAQHNTKGAGAAPRWAAEADGGSDDDEDGDGEGDGDSWYPVASASSVSSSGGSGRELFHPHARATDEGALLISALAAMKSWSIYRSGAMCCPLHRHVHRLGRIARQLKASPCRRSFRPFEFGQCDYCGILAGPGPGGGTCATCATGTVERLPSRDAVRL